MCQRPLCLHCVSAAQGLIVIKINYLKDYSDFSLCLLVCWHGEPKVAMFNGIFQFHRSLILSSGKSLRFMERSTNSIGGSLGIMGIRINPVSTICFLDLFTLDSGNTVQYTGCWFSAYTATWMMCPVLSPVGHCSWIDTLAQLLIGHSTLPLGYCFWSST